MNKTLNIIEQALDLACEHERADYEKPCESCVWVANSIYERLASFGMLVKMPNKDELAIIIDPGLPAEDLVGKPYKRRLKKADAAAARVWDYIKNGWSL